MQTTEITDKNKKIAASYELTEEEILTPALKNLLRLLASELEQDRRLLLQARRVRQTRFNGGETPSFISDHPAHDSDWKVNPIPADLLERRVEITGPVNSSKMVINMLNPNADGVRADMAMLDFEDSMNPTWPNVLDGVRNVIGAANGDLRFTQGEKNYELNRDNMAGVMVRVRGLHLEESNVTFAGETICGGLFDLVTCAYHTADKFIAQGKTPKFYIPKIEDYNEARWWEKLLTRTEELLGLKTGTLRVTALIETLPATFQIEEIIYELRNHLVGLNGGRWDKIFSDIKVLQNHTDRILADRAFIDMKKEWMDNYAKRLIKICHRRGAFGMGGMSAFTPGRDEETRTVQTEKVRSDKARESSIGHDGCWVSHPYFITIARQQFDRQNQLDVELADFPDQPKLLPDPIGEQTLNGLRTNIRVAIAYIEGWNRGLGCIALDGLMEDLATLEISRAQTWQWRKHGVTLKEGPTVDRDLIQQIFVEELDRLIGENPDHSEALTRAAQEAQKLFLEEELREFLTCTNEQVSHHELNTNQH